MSLPYNATSNAETERSVFSRREFVLVIMAGIMTIPAAMKLLSILGRFSSVPQRDFSGIVIPNWIPAGLEQDLTEEPRSINFGEDVVFVSKAKNGNVIAYSGVCTHAGCLVSFNKEKNIYECPCHGGKFNIDGEVIEGPPPRALDQHKVKISMGRVMVGRRKDG
jgi:cytochrome b6-f complex iron-sulfur subunit